MDTFGSLLRLEAKHRNLEWKPHTHTHTHTYTHIHIHTQTQRIIISDSISLISGEHEGRVGF